MSKCRQQEPKTTSGTNHKKTRPRMNYEWIGKII